MELEEVKTWQWMVAGLVAGLLFSCVFAWSGPSFDTQARDTVEQGEFENNAMALSKFGEMRGELARWVSQYHKGLPMLRDVTVHPPISSDPDHRYWVTGRAYFAGTEAKDPSKVGSTLQPFSEWRPFKFPANVPYVPGYADMLQKNKKSSKPFLNPNREKQLTDLRTAMGGKDSFPTVVDYLTAVSKLPDAKFDFKPAWWERPGAMWTLPAFAGLLLIGFAWPLTLGILQNYGVTKAPPVKVVPVRAPEPLRKPIRAVSTAGVVISPPASAKPLAPPQETKKYGGEFYPVVKTTKD